MTAKKGRRRFVYNGEVCCRYARFGGCHRVVIYSADKKLRIEEPFVDTEVSITPQTVREIPDKHFR